LLFGAKKIPDLAKGIGKGIKSFKSEMREDDVEESSKEKIEEKEETVSSTKVEETTKEA